MLTRCVNVSVLAIALAASAPALAKGAFFADLSGDQEVPPVASPTTGKCQIQFSKDCTEAEFTLRVDDGNQLFMSHLYCAPAGSNGPVVVWLAPLFRFHRWLANLRGLEIEEIKAVPCTPGSHPFVERLIGTSGARIRTACSSGMLRIWCASWTSSSITAMPPGCIVDSPESQRLNGPAYPPPLPLRWINVAGSSTAGPLFQVPIAA